MRALNLLNAFARKQVTSTFGIEQSYLSLKYQRLTATRTSVFSQFESHETSRQHSRFIRFQKTENAFSLEHTANTSPSGCSTNAIQLPDFSNHAVAFQNKSTWELIRALCVLRLCGFQKLVDNSLQIMNVMQKMCGPILLKVFVKPTLYNQFVAGETPGEFRNCVNRLKSANLRPFLGVTIESDVGEETRESTFDKNTQKILQCFDLSESLGVEGPFLQLKITGVASADLIARLSDIYNQSSIATRQILVKNIAACISGQDMTMQPFDQLEPEERESLMLAVQRLKEIGQCASKKMVRVLVDAEYTYINPGLGLFTMAMMVAFNQQFPLIWNTYQCYLKKIFETASTELGIVENLGGCFGAKVVRGAYLTQERLRAVKLGYPSPICDTYEHTNQNYNRVVKYFLEHINLVGPRCNIIVATHNEESVQLAIERMREMNIDPLNGGVHFGQLYGMCDQISFPLASAGYAVYKCVPYGPLLEVLPFLARRAMENKGVLTGSRKEKTLLWQELKRRMKNMMRLKTKHDLKVETV